MGYSPLPNPDEDLALRIMGTLAVIAVALLAVFLVFVHYFCWLPALIEILVIVSVLLIASASKRPFDLVIALMIVNLLGAICVLVHYFEPLPALKAIGLTILILLAAAWLIGLIWKHW